MLFRNVCWFLPDTRHYNKEYINLYVMFRGRFSQRSLWRFTIFWNITPSSPLEITVVSEEFCLPSASRYLLKLLFDFEDGRLLRNVGELLRDYDVTSQKTVLFNGMLFLKYNFILLPHSIYLTKWNHTVVLVFQRTRDYVQKKCANHMKPETRLNNMQKFISCITEMASSRSKLPSD